MTFKEKETKVEKSDITTNKEQLMIIALQQRIGEIVSTYEMQIASLRADVTILSSMEQTKDNAELSLD